MTVLGGIGTLWGNLVGAAVIVRLEDWLSTAGFEETGLVTGGIFIAVVLIFRRGVWGTLAHLLCRRTEFAAAAPEPHLDPPGHGRTTQRVPS